MDDLFGAARPAEFRPGRAGVADGKHLAWAGAALDTGRFVSIPRYDPEKASPSPAPRPCDLSVWRSAGHGGPELIRQLKLPLPFAAPNASVGRIADLQDWLS